MSESMEKLAVCIGCGCDDLHACAEGCSWIRLDRQAGLGVCSECELWTDEWDRGSRALSEAALLERELDG